MQRWNAIHCIGWILALAVVHGCGDGVTDSLWELPFDPDGTWDVQVQGRRSGVVTDDVLVLTLSRFGEHYVPPKADFALVELEGSWEWAGISGIAEGVWWAGPTTDANARDSGGRCPELITICSVAIDLRPSPGACRAPRSGRESLPIGLRGWFDGPTTLVGARLQGFYWEDRADDRSPCSGPEVIWFDTDVALTRR